MIKNNNRIGERRIQNCEDIAEIIGYKCYDDVTVKFDDGTVKVCTYNNFKEGRVCNYNTSKKKVYGVGIKGNIKVWNGFELEKSYIAWCNMLERCYYNKYAKKCYTDVTVCKKWLYYSSYKNWYDDNYYQIEGQKMDVDKDLLSTDNKMYSPDTCIIVPHNLNICFQDVKANADKIKELLKEYKNIIPKATYKKLCSIFYAEN